MRCSAYARVVSCLLLSTVGFVSGCDDDGSTTSAGADGTDGSTTSSSEPTTGESTSGTSGGGSAEGTTTQGESSTGSDSSSSTGGAGSTGSTSGDTSGTDDTTGASAVDVPFVEHDPNLLGLPARVAEGWVVVTSAEAWAELTQAPPPAGVTFPEQWVLFGSRGPLRYPGHQLAVEALTWQGGALAVDGQRIDPADDCETFDFIWPADTLVSFDALDGEVQEVVDDTASAEWACPAKGEEVFECDLETPCAVGSLCAGIVRSTVLAGNPLGFCGDASFRGTFTGGGAMIPSDGAAIELSLNVAGLATVDMDVAVLVDLDHPAHEELVIELRNPDGNQVMVADEQSAPLHPGGVPIVPTGFSGDESVNGAWTLVVTDVVDNANTGSVLGWDLEIMSRLD